jgi:hypothetical protein
MIFFAHLPMPKAFFFLSLMNLRNESNGKIKKFLPLQAFEILI